MAQAEEIGIPMQMRNLQRDLLARVIPGGKHFDEKMEVEETSEEDREEIELSLGLSLNGRFGIDPYRAKKLTRSSSIPDFVKENNETVSSCLVPMACASTPLIRTYSLPITETEEQWRKRKELQSLRRMEAKRKRSEKQRNWKAARDHRSCDEDNKRMDSNNIIINNNLKEKEQCMKGLNEFSCLVGPPMGFPVPQSQGSIGSQGSASSGISESESQSLQPQAGMNKCIEARSPGSVHSSTESDQKPPVHTGMTIAEKSSRCAAAVVKNQSNKATDADKGAKEIVRNVLEDMPCVSTKGDGPNGKRIEGFLYRYRKGEEVRIVCVCHGSFLTPAEFVKHAGGDDVAHPLKHIVVNPTPFL